VAEQAAVDPLAAAEAAERLVHMALEEIHRAVAMVQLAVKVITVLAALAALSLVMVSQVIPVLPVQNILRPLVAAVAAAAAVAIAATSVVRVEIMALAAAVAAKTLTMAIPEQLERKGSLLSHTHHLLDFGCFSNGSIYPDCWRDGFI
jgi:hypothetical protein